VPYRSEAQRGKFHKLLEQGKIAPSTVAEFDRTSAGMNLPDHVTPAPRKKRANSGGDWFNRMLPPKSRLRRK
jgi:hypothetical protein